MILLFSFIGEFFRMVIPLPVPASVYGLVLLLAALLTGVIKLDQVVTVATTVLVMGVTGQVTQRVIRWERKRKEGKEK